MSNPFGLLILCGERGIRNRQSRFHTAKRLKELPTGGETPCLCKTRKEQPLRIALFVAEREGFEPPVPLGTVVFKTTVIDHSTISPSVLLS